MTRSLPLVSVIVPCYNSAPMLDECLQSIVNQTYDNFELIVVDNNSKDDTLRIARKYTKHVYTKGPERSAQVNYGVKLSKGEYIYKVDSDFVLDPTVVEECVAVIQKGFDAIVVHNSPDVRVSWIAMIRKFEVDMYKYDLTHSSARFMNKKVFLALGGFNEEVTFAEDYDIQNRLIRNGYKTGFINAEALHLGEPKKFWPHMKKYYQYGQDAVHYTQHNADESKQQLAFFRNVYIRNWRRFAKRPFMGAAFIVYSTFKYASGGLGYAEGLYTTKTKKNTK